MNTRNPSREQSSLPGSGTPRGFAAYAWQRLNHRISSAWHWLAQTSRLAIGIPDYAVYREHMRDHHGGDLPLTRDEFFRDRLQARYGRGSSRCC